MKRTLFLGIAWLAAAAAAVALGFLAVDLVGASASPGSPPVVTAQPVAASDDSTSSPAPATAPTPTAPTVSGSGDQQTAGGTVLASCVDGVPRLAGVPAAGWEVEQYADHVEFRGSGQKVEVHVSCATGSPVFSVEGPRADGGSGDDSGPTSSSVPTVASTTPDDHGGDRGGHGSDDPPGDDHGGHGSDD